MTSDSFIQLIHLATPHWSIWWPTRSPDNPIHSLLVSLYHYSLLGIGGIIAFWENILITFWGYIIITFGGNIIVSGRNILVGGKDLLGVRDASLYQYCKFLTLFKTPLTPPPLPPLFWTFGRKFSKHRWGGQCPLYPKSCLKTCFRPEEVYFKSFEFDNQQC